jgi:HSP20 family protein
MFLVPVTRPSTELARGLDRLFDDTFERLFSGDVPRPDAAPRSPALDVAETEREYKVAIDLPGIAKDDIKITIDGRRVDVAAEAKPAARRDEGERLIHRERFAARFSRGFTLPEDVDQDASAAKLDSGVLTLTLAKKRAAAAKHLAIN